MWIPIMFAFSCNVHYQLKQSPSGDEGGSVDVLMCKELLGMDDLSAILRDKEKVGLMWNCKYLSANEKYENVKFLDVFV